MALMKVWKTKEYDQEQAAALAEHFHISPLTAGIILNRGLHSETEIREFLDGNPKPYHDPLLLKDMRVAAQRILKALKAREQITIYGDYDVDGISASSLLYLFLQQQGALVNTYIPTRKGEGYGLNHDALQTIAAAHTTLLITVDCGISGLKEVAEAPEGMDIIITDHHMAPEKLPPALAVIDPKQTDCSYPFKGLSGVGVAFKVCQAVYLLAHPDEPLWEGLTELAALGTVADIVPLRGENRELVKRGLKALPKTRLLGLQQLMAVSGCPKDKVSSENIGFILAPRLNAAGRLEHAQRAVELLTACDTQKAQSIAEELNQENARRQEISRQILAEAEVMLAEQKHIETAIVLAKEGWHAGVIGIVASRLVDKYHLPTILISIDGEQAKGSCRSIPALNLYEAIKECENDLIQFGGHHQAAGLTLKTENLSAFRQDFVRAVAHRLKPEDYQPQLHIDVVLHGQEQLSLHLLEELESLEPFGCDNPPPLFAASRIKIYSPHIFGKEMQHLRFFSSYLAETFYSVMWNGKDLFPCLYNNAVVDVAFEPYINIYQGVTSINLRVAALQQPYNIYDYRHDRMDKGMLLKKLLQVTDLVDVYVNKNESLPLTFRGYDNLHLCYYDEQKSSEASTLVFYTFPRSDVFEDQFFRQAAARGKNLYLLYDLPEYRKAITLLKSGAPDRNHLVTAYQELLHRLEVGPKRESGGCALETIVSAPVTAADVQIFKELGFIKVEAEQVYVGVIRKRQLEEAPSFSKAKKLSQGLKTLYQRNFQIASAEIIALWRHSCQKGS